MLIEQNSSFPLGPLTHPAAGSGPDNTTTHEFCLAEEVLNPVRKQLVTPKHPCRHHYCSMLCSKTCWEDPAAQDTAHLSHRTWRAQAGTRQEVSHPCWLAFRVPCLLAEGRKVTNTVTQLWTLQATIMTFPARYAQSFLLSHTLIYSSNKCHLFTESWKLRHSQPDLFPWVLELELSTKCLSLRVR